MIGIIIQLAISWLLLWLIVKKDLNVLALRPTCNRLLHVVFGLTTSAAIFSIYGFSVTFLMDNTWDS